MGVKFPAVKKYGDTMTGNLEVNINGVGAQLAAVNGSDLNRGFVAKTNTGKAQMGSNSNVYGVDLLVGGIVAQTIDTDFNQTRALGGGVSTQYPDFACRAWVNFNGTGTVAIRASGNVSSITDNGVGQYTMNFSTPMPDANYAVNATGEGIAALAQVSTAVAPNVSGVRLSVTNSTNAAAADIARVSTSIFR